MTTQDLEQVIRDCLRNIYNADYIGKLEVKKYPEGFLINLGLGTPEAPHSIYTELKGEKLIKFLKKEFRDMQINPYNFGYIQLTDFSSCNNEKKPCCDTR